MYMKITTDYGKKSYTWLGQWCIGYILWHIDPLLSNDLETNKKTMVVARQSPARYKGSIVGSSVFFVVLSEAKSRSRPSSLHLV
jgi:hypothetical protein